MCLPGRVGTGGPVDPAGDWQVAVQAYDARMKNRTTAYWQTRSLLAVGFIAMVVALPLSLERATDLAWVSWPAVLGLPAPVVVLLVGVALGLFGFAWMLRIFRGPRDEPPAWRYRDR